jgi:hypothetical protein
MKFLITVTKVAIFFMMLFYVYSRDAMIVTTLDMITSVLVSFTLFCILGNFMHETGTEDMSSILRRGPVFAFVSYMDVIALFHGNPQVSDILCILVRNKSNLFIYGLYNDALSTQNTYH